ncbi:ATP cone domain-containing protein, partial [Enterococcus faecalis]|uniref:ATP cone domain-containing protein n=1 Tax=Enterococcus faecalis TaxID=1351 RepID=UPI0022A6AA11
PLPRTSSSLPEIVDNVESRVRSLGENEVSTTLIGEYVMEDLVNLDGIAYIRFACVYRQFTTFVPPYSYLLFV